MPTPVLTKADFVRRFQANEFGNRGPTWHDVWHWTDDPNGHGTGGWNGSRKFHLRNRKAGGATYYDLTVNQLMETIPKVEGQLSDYYVAEMAPTERTLIQGEVQRTVRGLYLRYSTVRKPMREALTTSQGHTWGITAKVLLQFYMCPRSYEWLVYLLDTYTDHVIEFSTYGVNWGTVPGMNSVFWEVRYGRQFCESPNDRNYY